MTAAMILEAKRPNSCEMKNTECISEDFSMFFTCKFFIITVSNSSCGKVMFSQACVKNSVHGGGVCPIACWDIHTPTGQTPPRPGPTLCPRQTHPLGTPPQMATAADGKHPTGMHSCSRIILLRLRTHFIISLF